MPPSPELDTTREAAAIVAAWTAALDRRRVLSAAEAAWVQATAVLVAALEADYRADFLQAARNAGDDADADADPEPPAALEARVADAAARCALRRAEEWFRAAYRARFSPQNPQQKGTAPVNDSKDKDLVSLGRGIATNAAVAAFSRAIDRAEEDHLATLHAAYAAHEADFNAARAAAVLGGDREGQPDSLDAVRLVPQEARDRARTDRAAAALRPGAGARADLLAAAAEEPRALDPAAAQEAFTDRRPALDLDPATDPAADVAQWQATGHAADARALVIFLYGLLTEHLPAATVERLVRRSLLSPRLRSEPTALPNGHLARYAQELADRLTR